MWFVDYSCKQTIYTRTHVQTIVNDDHQASARATCVLQLDATTDSETVLTVHTTASVFAL